MKNTAFSLLVIFVSLVAQGQNEYNQWVFGYGAGLDFNTDPPTSFSSSLNSIEACGAICDGNGDLLFYTNGGSYPGNQFIGGVWNADNELMPNGNLNTSLLSQSAMYGPMIIQDPGNPSEYFIFHTDGNEDEFSGGLRYHKVDMTLEGGLGDVTEKDVLVYDQINEGVMCVQHINGVDFWLVVKQAYEPIMLAFLLTANGIEAPITHEIGTSFTGVNIMNRQGTKILVQAETECFYYDFDPQTGDMAYISDFVSFRSYKVFSPSGQYLYSFGYNPETQLFEVVQTDLNYLPDLVEAVIGTFEVSGWPMQLGPDDRIYMTHASQSTMSVIDSPDEPGIAANFIPDYIDLGSGTGSWGLPVYPILKDSSPTAVQTREIREIKVFPNPANDILNINLGQVSEGMAQIQLINALGQIVHTEHTVDRTLFNLDVSSFDTGMYTLVLHSDEVSTSHKITIK